MQFSSPARAPRRRTALPATTAGFALLEALLALLLFSVALAGACATLARSMHATHDAQLTTQAVELAADFAESLRDMPSSGDADALAATARRQAQVGLPPGARAVALELIDLAMLLHLQVAA